METSYLKHSNLLHIVVSWSCYSALRYGGISGDTERVVRLEVGGREDQERGKGSS